jgi:acyl-CoA thioesterase-2
MISDYSLLSTVFYPHPSATRSKHFMAASLDHAIWFHHPGKMDDWVLYDCDSPSGWRQRVQSRVFMVSGRHAAGVDRTRILDANQAR